MQPKEVLKSVPLFRNLGEDDLDLLADRLHRERYSKDTMVFRKGDFGDKMYIVDSGQVAVLGDGAKETIALMGPGSFVGETSLLLAQPRTAHLRVMLDAQLWVLDRTNFEELISSRPSIALEMLREISKRLVTTTQRKKWIINPRRITAVFGLLAMELAQAIFNQVKTPVGVLALPHALAVMEPAPSRGVMLLRGHELTSETLAEALSHHVELFEHVVVLLPNQRDPIAAKAVELADTIVSIGRSPAWFSPDGNSDHWVSPGTPTDLDRVARRLVNRTIGLALSSGGSRGLAHIGVLKVLMEEKIPIDMVAGTSAGALFGALYALGWSIDELLRFPVKLKTATRLMNWDFNLPPLTALVKGRIARDKLIAKWVENLDFEDTQTPIYMVAADAYTGRGGRIRFRVAGRRYSQQLEYPRIGRSLALSGPLSSGWRDCQSATGQRAARARG